MDYSSPELEWRRVDSIGDDRVFFLGGSNFAASCSATGIGLERGCIYFCNTFDDDLHVFNVETARGEIHKILEGLPELWTYPAWVLPVDHI
ncbi:hypothetical protein E2562_034722 [Oryza meyeriana var. granulata]|uniref:KIB1-4 beta-propeller domain-containing protein n=1 Tax=Oryza meyeriana var. granulata TaxID=110450 RepID=A0A6G1CC91_9ORYZ|nr:hypothetical protein E2562_034722 [Oryza meyeriana var. granulata]